jgi:hypothetical protein
MSDATCLGKTEVSVEEGFWRKTTNSTIIIECPNQNACKGGYFPENEYPVE